MKTDTRFWLTSFDEGLEQTKHKYLSFKSEIENNGCFKLKVETNTVKIYTPELCVIFLSKELPVLNMESKIETTLNGWVYLETYIKAYIKGEQYFDSNFQISPDVRYGVNAEDYVMDIHDNYFHRQHIAGFEGWGFVKNIFPNILTHKQIKELGYYSGIVNKVEEQVKAHPRIFAKFEKCEHSVPTQQTEVEVKPKVFEELFYNPEHAEPCLRILSELHPPAIDAINNYIGKAKGIFPLWVKVLKSHKPEPMIKHFKDTVYKDLLNQKVKGLNLSKDASEFRKQYKRIENDKVELDIKALLSQYSQSGKLGK
jgi:hypothetical protein